MGETMGKIDLPYVRRVKDRYGKMRYYYRRDGKHHPLSGEPGSAEFGAEYSRIHASYEGTDSLKKAPIGTFDELVSAYYADHKFTKRRESTKSQYRIHIEFLRGELGKYQLTGITTKVVDGLLNRWQEKTVTANNRLRYLKMMFDFAVKRKMLKANHLKGVEPIEYKSDGWKPWPEEALTRFSGNSTGSARVAFYLALYTGQRRADVLAMRWDAIKDGGIMVKQEKTGEELFIPLHPIMAAEIEDCRQQAVARMQERLKKRQKAKFPETIVHRLNGSEYTDEGFGTVWQREQSRCRCAGNPFHGLRKNATINLFEVGCTDKQVASVTGHNTAEMLALYSKRANQKKLAKQAMKKLVAGAQNEGEE